MTTLSPFAAAVLAALVAPGALRAWTTGNGVLGASCAIVTMRIACALLMTAQGALVPAVAELVWFVLLLWIALTSNSRYPLLLAAASLIGLLGSGLNLLDWVPYPPALAALVNASIALQGVCLMGAGIGLTRKPAHRTAQAL